LGLSKKISIFDPVFLAGSNYTLCPQGRKELDQGTEKWNSEPLTVSYM
jgi:hypothetical protein